MAELEIELKSLITATQFVQLNQHFAFTSAFTQTNYYFDTPDQQLYRQHCGLRLRVFADYAEQTLKVPTSESSTIQHELLEITDHLSSGFAAHKQLLSTGQVALALAERNIDFNQLAIFAKATTQRQIAQLTVGNLTLDHTYYPNDVSDYEIELETQTPAAAQEFFADLLAQFKIHATPVVNKVARAAQNQV